MRSNMENGDKSYTTIQEHKLRDSNYPLSEKIVNFIHFVGGTANQ